MIAAFEEDDSEAELGDEDFDARGQRKWVTESSVISDRAIIPSE